MAGIAVAAVFGDEQVFVLEAKVMDSFDDGVENPYGPLEWRVEASKFTTEGFPKIQPIATYPAALLTDTPAESRRSLGINSSFTRRGYNWLDVYPVGPDNEEKGNGFDIPGRIQYMDMWVWGSNLNYTIEAYFRDHQGMIRSVNMGSLAYEGWKNLRVKIPSNFLQSKKVLPNLAPLRFIKFRIWTAPTEIVDQLDPRYPGNPLDPRNPGRYTGVFIYFDNLRILTDMFEAPYDGQNLENIAKTQELWGTTAAADETN
jgi:hypothetical protein